MTGFELFVAGFIGASAAAVVAPAIIGTAISLGATLITSALVPNPRKSGSANLNSFAARSQGITTTVRQAITPHRTLFGEALISGPLTHFETVDKDRKLILVVTLCDGPIGRIGTVWIDGQPIFVEELDADGKIVAGKFANKGTIKKHLGESDQVADPLLLELASVDNTFRGRGIAYLVVQLDFDRDLFPTTPGTIAAHCQGREIKDPRTGLTKWTANAAVCVFAYFTDTRIGFGAAEADVDLAFINAAAKICDEIVTTQEVTYTVTSVDAATDLFTLEGEILTFETGDRVEVESTGTLPAGLMAATSYYVFVESERQTLKIALAASLADATDRIAVDLTDGGTGSHTVKKTGEPRYTINGVVESNRKHADVIAELLTAMGGRLMNFGGAFRIIAAAYAAPTILFSESDLRGAITITTRHAKRERFNAVKGIYVGPANQGQPANYPFVTNATFEAEDGRRLFAELDLPFTSRASTAQRLAKIELRCHRQEIEVQAPMKLTALRVQPGDICQLSLARYGFVAKEFGVVEIATPVEEGYLGLDVTLRETAAASFDFAVGEEQLTDPAPNSNLPDHRVVAAPGVPTVSENTFATSEAAGIRTKVILEWAASTGPFLSHYEVQYKLAAAADFIEQPIVLGTCHDILDLAAGTYDFRVRAVNTLGVRSDPDGAAWTATAAAVIILGLAAPTAAITGLAGQAISGMFLLTWDKHVDLDVRRGGVIQFRHATSQAAVDPNESTTIGNPAAGESTSHALALIPGTYTNRPRV